MNPRQYGLIRRTVRWPVDNDAQQGWPPQPPAAAASFDPASGFPWNLPDEAYQPQCWLDPTDEILGFEAVPLNATQAQAWNTPDEGTWAPVDDETEPALALGQPAELAVPHNSPDDGQYAPTLDDTAPAWAIQPPAVAAFNPATGFPWNQVDEQPFAVRLTEDTGDSDVAFGYTLDLPVAWNLPDGERLDATGADETAQPFAVQPPAVVVTFDPATGFPWNQDQGERFTQSQVVDDPMQSALGLPPQNAVSAQAFNAPDEGAYQTAADDTAQPYPIQPVSVAAFDPAGGFPWPVDDVIVTWPTYTDDTAQTWPAQGIAAFAPASGFPWNTADEGNYQPTPDESVQPWAITVQFNPAAGFPFNQTEAERPFPAWVMDGDAVATEAWTAPLDLISVVTGGRGPDVGSAVGSTPYGTATSPRPEH